MPEFFVPTAKGAKQAEKFYRSVKTLIAKKMDQPIDDRKIFALDFRDPNRGDQRAQVGEVDGIEREIVVAILKARDYPLYYVCTASRGAVRGGPIFISEDTVSAETLFDKD